MRFLWCPKSFNWFKDFVDTYLAKRNEGLNNLLYYRQEFDWRQ